MRYRKNKSNGTLVASVNHLARRRNPKLEREVSKIGNPKRYKFY